MNRLRRWWTWWQSRRERDVDTEKVENIASSTAIARTEPEPPT